MNTRVTVAYGDGIGPEIMESVLSILQQAEADLSIDIVSIGRKVYEQGWKSGITDSAWNTIVRNKIFLKAPITTPQGDGFTSLNVTIRKALGLYANIRPSITYFHKHVDLVVIRENEEDIYSGIEYRQTSNTYTGIKIISYDTSVRICKYAFEYAQINKRQKVTCFVKDNIMKLTDGTFHRAFRDVAKNYPDLKNESYILDIGAALLATRPQDFDVIVTTNLYGDVISDIAAEITGSVGLAGSANIGAVHAMFEAVHGSAPNIVGQNIANPSGLLNAAIYMLSYIGQHKVANDIYNAWYTTITQGFRTADIYNKDDNGQQLSKVSTTEFTQQIVSNLGSNKKEYHPCQYPCMNIVKSSDIKHTKKLLGVDLFIEWNSADIDEIVTRLLSVNSEDLELKNVLAKGLIIWPCSTMIKALPTDTVCCRFVAKNKETSHNSINLLLSELCGELEVLSLQKLYIFDNNQFGFQPI